MKTLDQTILESVLKKDTKDLEPKFVNSIISKYFQTNQNLRNKLEEFYEKNPKKIQKNKTFRECIKDIREQIRILYESFLADDFNKKNIELEYDKILLKHKSTKERIDKNEEIYSKINQWYKPKKIADLACGLNPIILSQFFGENIQIFCADLNVSDMDFINQYFKANNIAGLAKAYDLTTLEFVEDKDFISSDLVLLLKALDSFETIKSNISKIILEKIPQKKIVVSFPTKSLGQVKKIPSTKRNWIRNFIQKKNWKYEEFEIDNELFFLITKD